MRYEPGEPLLDSGVETTLEVERWQIEEIGRAIIEANDGKFAAPDAVDAFFLQWTDRNL